ncbi:hypothetical protein LCGC14_0466390 [marine sediment metagenome]|uniref:Uncharacterized protein n=1 Tax=marine sediment metagenome TaxID=412755 RepID=A0A0F9SIS2_9ZZZZ
MKKLLRENNYLEDLWTDQRRYNRKIREETDIYDREHWTQIYLLGIVSEIDEILSDIQWKRHRKKEGRKIDRQNLAYELADLTKYVISLWDLWDFTAVDMLNFVEIKTRILDLKYQQEFAIIPADKPILICDLDGTIADWRSSFISWVSEQGYQSTIADSGSTLMLDNDLSMHYPEYYALKEQFESEGGYRYIEPYMDGIATLCKMKEDLDIYIIIITARPADVYHRIWMDTWRWLQYYGINVDQLRIGSSSRVLLADSLPNENVIMFEDDPGLALRAANSGIRVFMRRQPYNETIRHENIQTVTRYTEFTPEGYFRKNCSV